MKLNPKIQKGLGYIIPVILFVIISSIYFSPVFKNKELKQHDYKHAKGAAKELVDFEKENPGEYSAWTNSMFSGMPAYQIKGPQVMNIHYYIGRILRFHLPYETVSILFACFLGFYILLISLKMDKWLSFLGALSFGLVSYNLIYIMAGHITRVYAMAFMAPVVAGFILTYRGNFIPGGILTMLALGIEIAMNHFQITYLLAMALGIFVVLKFIDALKTKTLPTFIKATLVVAIAAVFAVLPNITNLLTTYEYSKDTMRGKSELAELTKKDENENVGGLDVDYAFRWSYGKQETFSLMIPNAVGGKRAAIKEHELDLSSVSPEYRQYVESWDAHWGTESTYSGSAYLGAITCFLFVLGLFLVKNKLKWWLLVTTVLMILLSWGSNFFAFNKLFFDYFPMYNKFRVPMTTLVITYLTVPFLAILSVNEIMKSPKVILEKKNYFFISFALTGGIALLIALMPKSLFDLTSSMDNQVIQQQLNYATNAEARARTMELMGRLLDGVEIARAKILQKDAFRTLIFILLAAISIWITAKGALRKKYLIWGLLILVFVDMWTVDKRYISDDNFEAKAQDPNSFRPSKADLFIEKDKDINFRVFNVSTAFGSPFAEVNTSYFHKSLGGYHGAKLQRYQDLIDYQLAPAMQKIQYTLRDSTMRPYIHSVLSQLQVINMLNAKYIIYNPNTSPLINMNAFGNAWPVNSYTIAENALEEIELLDSIDLTTTAIVDKRFESYVKDLKTAPDTVKNTGLIKLIEYKPNFLSYQANMRKDELVVFSEVYYKNGWNAYIDGKKVEHIRANYILRALIVPSGNHFIEFKFEPTTLKIGKTIAATSSIIIILLILAYLYSISKGVDFFVKEGQVKASTVTTTEAKHKDTKQVKNRKKKK